MEKTFQTLIKKIKSNLRQKFTLLYESQLENNYKKIKLLFRPYKNQIISAGLLLCITLLVLTVPISLNYFETHENNFYSTDCYSILVDGQEICKTRDENLLQSNVEKIKKDLQENSILPIVVENKFDLANSMAIDSEISSSEEIYNILKSKVSYSLLAYSIKIDGESIGILESKYQAENVINDVKSYFTQNIEKESLIDVSTVEDIKIEQVKVNNTHLQNPETLRNYIIKGTNEEKKYTVEAGDSYWNIAEYFNMSLDDLISANPTADPEFIQIGDELNLIVPKPFVTVQVKRKITQEEKVVYKTEYEYVSYLYNDQEIVKQNGDYGISEIEAIVTEQNGIQIAKEVLSEIVISAPQTKVLVTGTQDPPPSQGTGYFVNPLPSSTVSSRFGSRSGGFHSGLDLAKSSGSQIKAADGGTVIFAGWQGSYGYMVEISHGAGFTTRYAHCSKLLVSRGDKVYQGKVVGLVGTTGIATGPHLHFEVRKYGKALNPSSYIGIQYN